MKIQFTGRHITVTPELKTYTEEKMERLKHRDHDIEILHIIYFMENITCIAEGTVRIDGIDLHGKGEADDMFAAVDALSHKLLIQITKHKEKKKGQ